MSFGHSGDKEINLLCSSVHDTYHREISCIFIMGYIFGTFFVMAIDRFYKDGWHKNCIAVINNNKTEVKTDTGILLSYLILYKCYKKLHYLYFLSILTVLN